MSLDDLEKELYYKHKKKITKKSEKKILNKRTEKEQNQDSRSNPNVVVLNNKKDTLWEFHKDESADFTKIDSVTSKIQRYGKVLIFGLVFLIVILLGVSGYYLYQFFGSKSILFSSNTPDSVLVGAPFTIDINMGNNTSKDLSFVSMSLSLPDGVVYVNNGEKKVITEEIGNLSAGESVKKGFKVVIVGDSNKTYEFNAVASYIYGKSSISNKFEKKISIKILARVPVISIDLSAPDKVLNGEDFEIDLRYKNVFNDLIKDAKISFYFPNGLVINGSDPKLNPDNTIKIQSLNSNQEKVIVVSASIIGKEFSFFNIGVSVEINIGNKYFKINGKSDLVSISPSPLSMRIESSAGDGAVHPGDILSYNIIYRNNSGVSLQNVVAKVKIVGRMADIASIKNKNGSIDSNNRTITWTAADIPEFSNLSPNQVGSVSFSIKVFNDYPIHNLSDKNFKIVISGEISSLTVPDNIMANKTVGVASVVNKVSGTLNLDQKLFFSDPGGQIINSGSLPPTIGVPVEYTVYWVLHAKGSDFENINIKAFLGPGIEWTGKVITNTKETLKYNNRTKEVIWNINKVFSGYGVVTDAPTAVFQIKVIPDQSQKGNSLMLIKDTSVYARDIFIGEDVNYKLGNIDSGDLSDTSLPDGYEKVK